MTSDEGTSSSADQSREKQLRQLEHDVKSYLGIVSTGLQALECVREDSDAFADLRETIEEEGVKPLNQVVASIVTIALATSE